MIDGTYVIGDGTIEALAGGPLSLGSMGHVTTRRASNIEFNDPAQKWEVLVDDVVLFTHLDYDACLTWERDHFNALLAT